MTTKIKIKMGKIEFDYEGDAAFTQDDIKELFTHLEGLSPSASESDDTPGVTLSSKASTNGVKKLHTTTIASRIGGKGAQNLVLAAAAHLQIVDSKESFSRQELLNDMKAATTHYKSTMSNNLTGTIATMIAQQSLNQLGTDSYSLSDTKLKELESLIAQ